MLREKSSLEKAKSYSCPLERESWALKLDLNENIIGTSPKVVETLKSITVEDLKFYPVYGDLIKKLAEFNNIEENSILTTNGADDGIKLTMDTFVEPNEKIVSVTPSFVMNKFYANVVGAEFVEVPYKEPWVFPTEDFIEHAKTAKLAIITTPNSPTGEAIKRDELLKVLDNIPKTTAVLIDETYSMYAGATFIDLIEQYSNIIIVRSMSKDFALAGLRMGYLVSNSHNINLLKKSASPFSTNTVAAKLAIRAMDDIEHFERTKKEIEASKAILTEGLETLGIKVYSSDSNFILADFGMSSDYIYKKLILHSIKVKKFENQPLLENHFRITVPPLVGTNLLLKTLNIKELLVFDMDGVLVDTSQSYRFAIQKTVEKFTHRTVTLEEVQNAKNRGGLNNDWDLTEYLIQQSGFEVDRAEMIDSFQKFYLGDNFDGFIQNEKLLISKENLEQLSKKFDLAVFTGRPREEAFFALKNWDIEKYFLSVVTMDNLPMDRQKPHPMGLHVILELIKPKQAYYIGDTADDMRCATSANVHPIAVLPPQDKSESLRQSLQKFNPMLILDSTDELLKVFN